MRLLIHGPVTRAHRASVNVTLVELVMYIMVVSIGVAGILLAMTMTSPAQRRPDGARPGAADRRVVCGRHSSSGLSTRAAVHRCPEPEGAGRTNYDNVCDYHNLANNGCASAGQGICDQLRTPVTGLRGPIA